MADPGTQYPVKIFLRRLFSFAHRVRAWLRGSPGAAVVQGNQFIQAGRFPQAVRSFQDAILADPVNADAWQGIGRVAAQSGRLGRVLDAIAGVTDGSTAGGAEGSGDEQDRYARRQGLPLADIVLAEFLPEEKFVLLDGGALEAESDARWGRMDTARVEIHGFEPDKSECTLLNALAKASGLARHYYPVGLWSVDGTLPFHENHASGGSSFMDQNRAVTDRWKFENPTQTSLAREIFRPKRTYDVRVVTLATWARENRISAIDFVKLNVQGGELEILRTAGPVLDTVLGLLAEVSFCESYVGRPLFTDIDVFLRNNGFVFFDLLAHHYIGRADSPVAQQHLKSVQPQLGQLVSAWGQLVEGHALYLRDPIARQPTRPADKVAARRALKLACIAEIYGQIEYAFELLQWVSRIPEFAGALTVRERAASAYLRFY